MMCLGDNWIVTCDDENWMRTSLVSLHHKDTGIYAYHFKKQLRVDIFCTEKQLRVDIIFPAFFVGKYLYARSRDRFTQRNCPNCPIIGQV